MRSVMACARQRAGVLAVGLLCGLLLAGCGGGSGGISGISGISAANQPTTPATASSSAVSSSATKTPTAGSTKTPGETHASIKIIGSIASGFQFVPTTLTIRLGTTVTWTNATSTPHTSTSDAVSPVRWDSGVINPEGSFSFTFTRGGTFYFHCSIHPSMHGAITVTT